MERIPGGTDKEMRSNERIQMVATDLDGTLLNDRQQVSIQNQETLHRLKALDVLRVVATGRSYYSFNKVIPPDFPIDYLVFSTGAGIMEWPSGRLVYSRYLPAQRVEAIARLLTHARVDFMIHHAIPQNQFFDFFHFNRENHDFHRRCQVYGQLGSPGDFDQFAWYNATQILAIFPPGEGDKFTRLAAEMNGVKVIKATSPLDHRSLWMEIFPAEVSKGKAIEWICERENIHLSRTLGLGNDYNDLDLLRTTRISYVVENAAEPLRKEFTQTRSNNDHGFTQVMEKYFWRNKK